MLSANTISQRNRLMSLVERHGGLLRDYGALISGSVGRLVFSLGYFVLLANAISVAEFGAFAASVAMGMTLSRLLAFGFFSPVYRTATVRPQLTGTYLAGFGFFAVLSLPLIAGAAYFAWALIFSHELSLATFGAIVATEVLLWRIAEIVIVINNGFKRFQFASLMVIFGTFAKMAAALAFVLTCDTRPLETWVPYYVAANLISYTVILSLGLPRQRYRFVGKLYPRRLREALSVMMADLVFYAQMELDKVLVFALVGGKLAGIYAILMRLADLTALPMRSAMTLLVQKVMQVPDFMAGVKRRVLAEVVIFTVSTMALLALAVLMWIKPDILGSNVAVIAPVVLLAALIPGPRNITEYHAELFYARGQTWRRAFNLGFLAILKGLLMILVFEGVDTAQGLIWMTALVFTTMYLASLLLTYPFLNVQAGLRKRSG